jgi:hypothetical protein
MREDAIYEFKGHLSKWRESGVRFAFDKKHVVLAASEVEGGRGGGGGGGEGGGERERRIHVVVCVLKSQIEFH